MLIQKQCAQLHDVKLLEYKFENDLIVKNKIAIM